MKQPAGPRLLPAARNSSRCPRDGNSSVVSRLESRSGISRSPVMVALTAERLRTAPSFNTTTTAHWPPLTRHDLQKLHHWNRSQQFLGKKCGACLCSEEIQPLDMSRFTQ